jgi:hypothetical protein
MSAGNSKKDKFNEKDERTYFFKVVKSFRNYGYAPFSRSACSSLKKPLLSKAFFAKKKFKNRCDSTIIFL